MSNTYSEIVTHYESCLEKFGDTHLGVDWPNQEEAQLRYKIMLESIRSKQPVTVLDFGCGTSHLYEYILKSGMPGITYAGLDISEKFVAAARQKFPAIPFYCFDILTSTEELPSFDYIIMNGVFTEKLNLSFDEMYDYFEKMLLKIFPKANVGLAFNVMSKHVDWERKDLFHVPFDRIATFLTKSVSRHFVIRHDYKLYEYTVYVYKSPNS